MRAVLIRPFGSFCASPAFRHARRGGVAPSTNRLAALIPSIAIAAVAEGETRVSRSWALRRALEVGVEELERRARKVR